MASWLTPTGSIMAEHQGLRAADDRLEPKRPDPARSGPYLPFTSDPQWSEAWWWLGFPILVALLSLISFTLNPTWYAKWVNHETFGILEVTHFILPLIGFVIGARLLFSPFVQRRPLVILVTMLSVLSCLYIAGEEISWGQKFFGWDTPEFWKGINLQHETNLHNVSRSFDQRPRSVLEFGIAIGGLLIPLAAAFDPRVRANRFSLFLPAAALLPTALGVIAFMLVRAQNARGAFKGFDVNEVIETYLFFFIFAYMLVFARRLRELGGPPLIPRRAWMTLYVGMALFALIFQIWIRLYECAATQNCVLSFVKAMVWSAIWPAYWIVYLAGLPD